MRHHDHYEILCNRISNLERRFLPEELSSIGEYTETDYDKVRAFRLLAHSEIESYLEAIARNTAVESVKAYKKKNLASIPIIGIINRYGNKKNLNKVDDCIRKYISTVKNNSGIKEQNVIILFTPLGFLADDLFLSVLNSYGTARGEVAHTSAQVQRPPDPGDEKKTIKEILGGLRAFDHYYKEVLQDLWD